MIKNLMTIRWLYFILAVQSRYLEAFTSISIPPSVKNSVKYRLSTKCCKISFLGSCNKLTSKFTSPRDIYDIKITKPFNGLEKIVENNWHNFPLYLSHRLPYLGKGSLAAFINADSFVKSFYEEKYEGKYAGEKAVILDSGCGRGLSTVQLGAIYPEIPVVGIDRSEARLGHYDRSRYSNSSSFEELVRLLDIDVNLSSDEEFASKGDALSETSLDTGSETRQVGRNVLLVRADLVDFWILAMFTSNWVVKKHFLLHPNPYPKPKLVKLRWHAHAVFPALLFLGGDIVTRSNWRVYCEEQVIALNSLPLLSFSRLAEEIKSAVQIREFKQTSNQAISHFDRKYLMAGVEIYETEIKLSVRDRKERLHSFQEAYRLDDNFIYNYTAMAEDYLQKGDVSTKRRE